MKEDTEIDKNLEEGKKEEVGMNFLKTVLFTIYDNFFFLTLRYKTMSLIKTLVINSQDRTSGSTSSANFLIRPSHAIDLTPYNKISLKYAHIYGSIYNINDSNNTIDLYESKTETKVSLVNGFYTGTSLASHLKTRLDAKSTASNTFTCTYNTSTKKMTITADTANFQLLFSTGTNKATSPWKELGFSSTGLVGIDTTDAKTCTSNQMINTTKPNMLYITINEFKREVMNTGSQYFTFVIPNNSVDASLIEFKSNEFFEQEIDITGDRRRLCEMTISMRERNNDVVELNGTEWCMILKFD